MARSFSGDDYFDNEDEINANIESLSGQNPLLGETLKRIMRHIYYVDIALGAVAREEAQDMTQMLRKDIEELIVEVAKDYAEYESEELRRRLDRMFSRHSSEIERLYAWRHRVDEKLATRTGRSQADNPG